MRYPAIFGTICCFAVATGAGAWQCEQPQPGGVLPLSLNLAGRPGVPQGTDGSVYVGVPVSPQDGCVSEPPPPVHDILGGDGPKDLLRGPMPRVVLEPTR